MKTTESLVSMTTNPGANHMTTPNDVKSTNLFSEFTVEIECLKQEIMSSTDPTVRSQRLALLESYLNATPYPV